MDTANCKCCSGLSYDNCCKVYHLNMHKAKTPLALMRSRYCAYALHLADYLVATTHPNKRNLHQRDVILNWAKINQWLKLEIIESSGNLVEFKAYYLHKGILNVHHEQSKFIFENELWYYYDAKYPI